MREPRSVDSSIHPSDGLVDQPAFNPTHIGRVENEIGFFNDRGNAFFFGTSELPITHRDVPNRAGVVGRSKGGNYGFLTDPIKDMMRIARYVSPPMMNFICAITKSEK